MNASGGTTRLRKCYNHSTCIGTEKNGCPYISIASDELKSLVIYTDKFNTHIPIHIQCFFYDY